MRLGPVLAVASQLAIASVGAQTAAPVDTIAEARRLRDEHNFAGAASLMRPYVASHQDDPGSARFAALMTYWAKDRAAADSIYARALVHHSADADLRLEYARFLIETGNSARATDVLAPFVAGDPASFVPGQIARARTLLGTAAYWRGDFTSARNESRAALALDSSVTDARRQLTEIEIASASWVRVATDGWDDDQPLRYATFEADGGWFLNPLTPLGVHASATAFDNDGVSESVFAASANFTSYLPGAHLDVSASAGVLQRSFDVSTDWTGGVSLGGRLPRTIRVQAKYDRAPYTNTARSLGRAIMVQTLEGNARWGTPRKWMGELVGRRESYPDDNHISTGFGWILAPVSAHERAAVHIGYGFSAQSAARSRFSPRGNFNGPPGQVQTTVLGEYNPYYTPRNLRVHSALATAGLEPNKRWTIDASGRYGVSGHDDAPVLVGVATPPTSTVTRGFYDRSFHPWNARGAIGWAATPAVRLGVGVEHGRDAYYAFTSGRVQLTYTFVTAAAKRAELR